MGGWSSIVGILGVVAAPFTGGLSLIATAAAVVAPKVVDKVVDFVMKPFMKAFGVPDTPDIGAESIKQEGYLVTRQGGNEALPVIYGFRATGGTVVYAETGPLESTPKNKYLWVAYALCEGPVEGLKTLSLDDRDFPESIVARLNAGETVDVSGIDASIPSFKYNGVTKLRFYNGVYYNTPSASPVGTDVKAGVFKDAPNFTTDMVFNGVAVLFARYEIIERTTQEQVDNNPFSGGVPSVLAGIMGRKVEALGTARYTNGVYDAGATATMVSNINSWWTSKSSSESSGTSSYDSNGGRYSTNPAECLFDYLRNTRYGKGLLLTDIDKDTWIAAANKCNQFVTYYTGARGPILTCNYIVDTGQTLFNNTKTMLAGFRAYMPYVQGKYKLKIEDAGNEYDILSGSASIVATLVSGNRMSAGYDDNVYDIVGDVTYTGIERTSKYNQVVVSYVDPDQKWSSQQAVWPQTEAERQIYIAEDGYRENKGEFTMYTITNSIMALDMARLIFNKSRYQESCTVSVSAEGFELEPGDNIRIQSNVLNFGTVAWRVISTTLNSNYTFEVSCVRNPDSIYPYGRYNEPDVVRGVYIPRQNEIYLPSQGKPLMGIFPPSYAPMPSNWTGNVPPGNTPPTTPTNPGTGTTPGGGGVGGGGGSISGGTPVTNPPAPTPPAVIKTIDDVITYTSAIRNGNTWTINFTAPNAANYSGFKVWWRPQLSGINNYYEAPDVSSGSTSFTITTNTPTIRITVITRVKYSNGEFSIKAAQAFLKPEMTSAYNPANGILDFTGISTMDMKPFDVRAPLQLIEVRNVSPVTTPRSLSFKLTEPLYTDPTLSNGIVGSIGIKNVHIWYRRYPIVGTDAGFSKVVVPVNNTVAYETFSFTVANAFGTENNVSYQFNIQWEFIDGSMGTKQLYFSCIVDDSGMLATYQNIDTYRDAIPLQLKASTSVINSTASPNIITIERPSSLSYDSMRIYFWNPTNKGVVDWAGMRVRLSPVSETKAITYTTYDKTSGWVQISPGTDQYYMDITGVIAFNTTSGKYNIVVSLLYYDGTTLKETYARKYSGIYYVGTSGNQIGINGGLLEDSASPAVASTLTNDSGKLPVVPSTKQIIKPDYVGDYGLRSILYLSNTQVATQLKVRSFRLKFTIPTADAGGNPITFNKIRVYRRWSYYNTRVWSTDQGSGYVSVMEYTDITAADIAANPNGVVLRYGRDVYPSGYDSTPNVSVGYDIMESKTPQIFIRLYTGTGAGTASDCVVWVPFGKNPATDNTWWDGAWLPTLYSESVNKIDLSVTSWSWFKTIIDACDAANVDSKDAPLIFWQNDAGNSEHKEVIR